MVDEKRLIEKLEKMAKESREEAGLKEPALLRRVAEEVKAMAVNEEIRQRIEKADASDILKYDPYSLLGEIVTCEVQVTLRSGDHIGHVWFKHIGDRTELSAFGFDFKDIDHEDDVPHNDCDLSYSERFDGFCVELKNDKGDIESIKEESAGFLNSLVASIEITDCYKEKSCYTCEEWEPGFERCRHPDQPQSLADDYMAPRDHCCDLWMAKG
ncbi:MAG: hypothetical protein HFE75_05045 [Firmicutes bacterium]|jgi:hypothetical protein|nr:hypothetical protein [Bacillota bacterium]